ALRRGQSDLLSQAAGFLRCLSPIPAVMEILGQSDVGAFGMASEGGVVWRFLVMALVVSAACAAATIVRLNQSMLDRARSAGVMTQDRSVGQQIARRLIYLVDPQRRSGGMSLWVNPVMAKEFRSRRFGRSHWTLRLIAVSAILSLAISVIAATGALGWGVEVIGGGLVLLQVSLLIVFAPSLAAGLVSSEREKGTWRLLRMTPLSSGVVLRGKLMSVAWPLLLLLCAALPGYAVMMTIKPLMLAGGFGSLSELPGQLGQIAKTAVLDPQIQRVAISLALTAVLLVLISAAASTLFRSTAAAMTASYIVILAICAAPLLVWMGAGAPFGRETVAAALVIDPAAAALKAAEMPGFTEYELLPANWWIVGVACVALLAFLWLRTGRLFRADEG
ncbi:MAG TPA: hypothetical protein VMS17_14555, partial [Gemmataceae bacterium]|nr:hypothetical protein [Gemmataceae bacterium]